MTVRLHRWFVLAACAAAATVSSAQAQLAEYYIGVDGRNAPFTAPPADGGGDYPDNPNFGRLTFLYNHGDHYHGIGVYTYTGPAASPTLVDTNANNRIPETFTGQPPLELLPGSGVYAGRYVTMHQAGVEYSDLEIRNVHSLDGVDDILFNSSSGRWNGSLDGADIHLKLLSVSSPHLNVGSPSDPHALPVGGDVHLGEGDEIFSFTPVLWVDNTAPTGHYWAEFQLLDLSGAFLDSGRFSLDVQHVVPEPTAWIMLVIGAVLTSAYGRRRARCVR